MGITFQSVKGAATSGKNGNVGFATNRLMNGQINTTVLTAARTTVGFTSNIRRLTVHRHGRTVTQYVGVDYSVLVGHGSSAAVSEKSVGRRDDNSRSGVTS